MAKSKYLEQIGNYAKEITYGTILAIDPGSTRPGFAAFHAGICVHSSAITLPAGTIYERLQSLATEMTWISPVPPDVVVIEELRGSMVHMSLAWAVGVHLGGVKTSKIVELPIHAWKAVAVQTPSYFKDDEQDAIMIGKTAIILAQEMLYAQAANPYLLRARTDTQSKPRKTPARTRKKLE